MISKISFLTAFVLIFSCGMSQPHSDNYEAFEKHLFKADDDSMLYRLLTPDSIQPGKRYPLVIFFHGSEERGNDNISSLKHIAQLFLDEHNRKDFPTYLLVPQCPKELNWTYPGWYDEPRQPMRSVIKLIEMLMNEPTIDTTRIYLTGLSMGGYATWYLLTRFPGRFAAAVPICGGGDWHRVSTFSRVPIWAFHGRKDDVVPVEQSRNMINALQEAGGEPRYTEYKRVKHNSWEDAYQEEELLKWIFGHRRL
jgi:predicted peptidase